MRATRLLKTPGIAIGSVAHACRSRSPGDREGFGAREVGATPGLREVEWGGTEFTLREYSMATDEQRQSPDAISGAAPVHPPAGLSRFRRFLLALGTVVLLGMGGFLLYDRWQRNRTEEDSALVAELQGARLVESTQPDQSPGDWPRWRGPRRDGVSLEKDLNWDWPE